MDDISRNTQSNDSCPHRGRPICSRSVHRETSRKAGKDDSKDAIEECKAVDPDSPAAEGPARWWQGLAFQTPEEDTADGKHVGRKQCKQGKRDDDVEAERRSEIDEAENSRYD